MDIMDAVPGLECAYTGALTDYEMDQELKPALKEMAKAITALARNSDTNGPKDETLNARLATLEERSNWHRNIGWGIAGVAACLFTGLVTWYLPSQLSSTRDGIKSDTAEQLLPLQIQLAKLTATAALKESKDVSQAIQQSADFSTPRLAIEAVRTIAQQAKVDKLNTQPSVLQEANTKIQTAVSSDPALASEGWAATLALVEYRSALPPGDDRSSPPAPRPQHPGLPVVTRNTFDGGVQKLDGFYWKDQVFRNMKIEYDGGPVELENVQFINCTFMMKYSPKSESFADLILSQSAISGSVS